MVDKSKTDNLMTWVNTARLQYTDTIFVWHEDIKMWVLTPVKEAYNGR